MRNLMKRLGIVLLILTLICTTSSISNYALASDSVNQPAVTDISTIVHINSIAPPKGFTALTATDVELAKYGIPERPKDKTLLKKWEEEMSLIKEFIPLQVQKVDVQFGLSGTVNTRNYAGYRVNATDNTNHSKYTNVYATWNVPTSVNSSYSTGVWVGLHGNGMINQAGTCDFNPDNGGGYGFWYENYPEAANRITNLSVSGGDSVKTSVTYNPTTSQTTFFFSNYTTGKAGSYSVTTSNYDGGAAEYIVENPYWSTNYYENFGTVNFSSCILKGTLTTGGTTTGEFTAFNYRKYNMSDSSGKIKGQPGSAYSGGNFSVTYMP